MRVDVEWMCVATACWRDYYRSQAAGSGWWVSKSYVGLVATGDSSIEAALRNSGIKTIHYVDWDAFNILGVYGEYKCVVFGE